SCSYLLHRPLSTLSLHDALPIFTGHPLALELVPLLLDLLTLPLGLRPLLLHPAPAIVEPQPVEGQDRTSGQSPGLQRLPGTPRLDRKSTRLNSSHQIISYAVFCL